MLAGARAAQECRAFSAVALHPLTFADLLLELNSGRTRTNWVARLTGDDGLIRFFLSGRLVPIVTDASTPANSVRLLSADEWAAFQDSV